MKQRNKEMEVDASPQHSSLCWPWGKSGSQQGCCGGGWGWGRQVPRKDGESFALISQLHFVLFTCRKRKKKKKLSLTWWGDPH
uniref:Uncharacterized protein n=1 Tax=Myotis myotis TaxID=51298 RepID=A0A7J7VZJ7_MYOMY|nr:hypothetical protein mMyoMyo1_012643 [Myotis myotis]